MTVQSYAIALAEAGYAALAYDFCGGSTNSRSDGKTTEMSIFTEEDDLKTVVAAVKNVTFVDINNISLLGCSQGGMVSAMVAADIPEDIEKLILIYPAFSCADDARNSYSSVTDIPDEVNFMGMNIGKIYYEYLLDYDPYQDITRYMGSVLIQHGTNDAIVNITYSETAEDSYSNATLIRYSGAGHGFQGQTLKQSESDVIAFLKGN